MGNLGYRYSAGLKGSKFITVGRDPDIFNYTSLATAVSEADNGQVILIEPGTWTLTATLSIDKPLILMGTGGPNDTVITSALATRTVMLNVPAYLYGAEVVNRFVNLKITNSSTGDGIEIDNDGGAAQNLSVTFENCTITSKSGVAMDLDQTTTSKDIFLNVSGDPALHEIGASTLDQTKATSYILITGMKCGVFTLSNTNVASIFNMIHCVYATQAETLTGHASKFENYVGNLYGATSYLSAALTKGAAGDFDASGTEAAILYT